MHRDDSVWLSNQFPFYKPINDILGELKKRDWDDRKTKNISVIGSRGGINGIRDLGKRRFEVEFTSGVDLILKNNALMVYGDEGASLHVGSQSNFVVYKGSNSIESPGWRPGQRPRYLVPDKSAPIGQVPGRLHPKYFETAKVYAEFTTFFEKILRELQGLPL